MKEIIAAAIGALVSMALSALMTMKESSRFFSSCFTSASMFEDTRTSRIFLPVSTVSTLAVSETFTTA